MCVFNALAERKNISLRGNDCYFEFPFPPRLTLLPTIVCPTRNAAVVKVTLMVGSTLALNPLYLGSSLAVTAGYHSVKTIFCICAPLIFRAVSKSQLSVIFGYTFFNSFAMSLCSRNNTVCRDVSTGCSLALWSPAMKNSGLTRGRCSTLPCLMAECCLLQFSEVHPMSVAGRCAPCLVHIQRPSRLPIKGYSKDAEYCPPS